MAKIQWDAGLNTGIREIDRQHMRIIEYLNQMDDLHGTREREKIGQLIEETVDYTCSHFVFEEDLLEKAGYFFTEPHRKVHDIFIRRINELKNRFHAGEDVAEDLRGLLSRWLLNHIRTEDHNYVESVTAYMKTVQRARTPPRQASSSQEMDQEMLYSEDVQKRKKSWLRRLFG